MQVLGERRYDVVAVGELLVDLISTSTSTDLASAPGFERYQGGSVANVAANIARLGGRSALVANVGPDAFGRFLRASLETAGVDTSYITDDPEAHTSVVFVAHTAGSPDFIAIRGADGRLGQSPAQRNATLSEAVTQARGIHVSMWPLSVEPARGFVREVLELAHCSKLLTSLDPNYSARIWPNRAEALEILQSVLPNVTVTKPSLDDAERLFGEALKPIEIIRRFHEMGPRIVMLTMGSHGTLVSDESQSFHVPARPIQIADATGAGDAFWAGFLMACLDGLTTRQAAYAAREFAETKIQTIGPMLPIWNRHRMYEAATEGSEEELTGTGEH